MEKGVKSQSLHEILLMYNFLTFDNCGLTKFLPHNTNGSSKEHELQFIYLVGGHVERGDKCYIPPEVKPQYLNPRLFRGHHPSALELEIFEARKGLVVLFTNKGRILTLNRRQRSKLDQISKALCKECDVSGIDAVDLKVLLSGFVCSFDMGPGAVVTNDSGIFKIWMPLLDSQDSSYKDFGLYKRRGPKFFEGWWLDKNYN
jgi:hypothetical protein